jgi:hypothetical protein
MAPVELLKGIHIPEAPIELERASGSDLRDFVWTTRAIFFVVSARVISLLSDVGATGWTAHRAVMRDAEPEPYYALAISGRCGPLDRANAELAIVDYPGGAIPVATGLGIDAATLDGSDIFMPDDTSAWVIVSGRLAAMFTHERVTNVALDDPDEIELF